MDDKIVKEKQHNYADLIRSIGLRKPYYIWMTFLTLLLLACLYAYYLQLRDGLIVTGLRDYVSWGMYIANFVFFVAVSLIGMLISSVLGLAGAKWITPVSRIAEFIAVAFAIVAGLVIIADMGRPDRVLNLFIHGRFQSMIIWDIVVVITYATLCLLLLYIPLIPDAAVLKNYEGFPKWQRKMYSVLSMGWAEKPGQIKIIKRMIMILLVTIIPVAFAIHTVTSWLFASTMRTGWDSTIFGPYFLAGAFVAGAAAVVIVMYVLRNIYKLKKYITDLHFDRMGKIIVLLALVYAYFNINEFIVPAFKLKTGDDVHLYELFTGHWAGAFWFAQILGLVLPIILLLFKPMRKPLPMFVIAILVLLASWVKRYIIVVPTMLHPKLPIQNVPQDFIIYTPTLTEIAITIAPFIIVTMIISILAKLFPVVPMWEVSHEIEQNEN